MPFSIFISKAKRARIYLLVLPILTLLSCREVEDLYEAEPGEELSGGQTTVFDKSPGAFSHPAPGLTGLDELEFFVGNSFFNQNWVSAPASTTARDGLGPLFNARSCSGCHFKDGRGRAPSFDGETGTGYLLRLGHQSGSVSQSDPLYGGQLQDQALPGVPVEGGFTITYTEVSGSFADGESYSLRQPQISLKDGAYGAFAPGLIPSPRVANQMIGLGLLEAISEADILAQADPNDLNEDGISGRANYVWDRESQEDRLGRFGWKANQPSLRQQSAAAFLGDMGITSSLFPDENCTSVQLDCQQAPNGGSPEIEDDDLRKVVLYVSNLSVPARRDYEDQQVLQGKNTFYQIGCASCHTPSFTTGPHPDFGHLAGQKIWPYTDLLLHDMGEGLADGRSDFLASGQEWKTPPLWGIGLFEVVNHHSFYLHDGRARNLQEAILWHGGEAKTSADSYKKLSAEERENLLKFLRSL